MGALERYEGAAITLIPQEVFHTRGSGDIDLVAESFRHLLGASFISPETNNRLATHEMGGLLPQKVLVGLPCTAIDAALYVGPILNNLILLPVSTAQDGANGALILGLHAVFF